MTSIKDIEEYVSEKALAYLRETDDTIELDKFPTSIVDFVIEYVIGQCHFPSHFKDKEIVAALERGKNSLAMACADVFAKAGAEGETSHTENGVGRTYKNEWITFDLLSNFPNYVQILK